MKRQPVQKTDSRDYPTYNDVSPGWRRRLLRIAAPAAGAVLFGSTWSACGGVGVYPDRSVAVDPTLNQPQRVEKPSPVTPRHSELHSAPCPPEPDRKSLSSSR